MDFSDIRTIIIGEAGEYGKRLVRYLEIHLSSAVRVYHFTTAEGMVSFKEEAEIYLLDERFFKELSEEKQKFLKQKKLIILTWREDQGSFCKYVKYEVGSVNYLCFNNFFYISYLGAT